ncbi:hypothetical protein [Arthrobacter koreensis]|uniref:hypothetical protein n=1 Tax=Arthrobacter koreensis TaxID=199136 RepID=UPI0037F894B1
MSFPSSPGKMDLSALGVLKKRTLEPVPDVPEAQPSAQEAAAAAEPVTVGETPAEAPPEPAPAEESPAAAPVKIEPADEDHSGYVTLYLPKDLDQWLAAHHDQTRVSYPGIVLNAISWAVGENRMAEIFAPVDSPIPANDIFGRAPVISRPERTAEPKTRPIRFRKDHMRVIISLARTWTADNRNAFFTAVLTAYRDHLDAPAS